MGTLCLYTGNSLGTSIRFSLNLRTRTYVLNPYEKRMYLGRGGGEFPVCLEIIYDAFRMYISQISPMVRANLVWCLNLAKILNCLSCPDKMKNKLFMTSFSKSIDNMLRTFMNYLHFLETIFVRFFFSYFFHSIILAKMFSCG